MRGGGENAESWDVDEMMIWLKLSSSRVLIGRINIV